MSSFQWEKFGQPNHSDTFVACKNDRKIAMHVVCHVDGTLEIDGQTGDDITLPNCSPDPIGCDLADLEEFNTRLYTAEDGCTVGYFEFNGKTLEKADNKCNRDCGQGVRSVFGQIFTLSLLRFD